MKLILPTDFVSRDFVVSPADLDAMHRGGQPAVREVYQRLGIAICAKRLLDDGGVIPREPYSERMMGKALVITQWQRAVEP